MKSRAQPKTRNWQAVSAHFRKAGAMGGTPRQQNRRDRRVAKHETKRYL